MTTRAASEQMTVIELPQGYYRELTGMPVGEAMAMFKKFDDDFLRDHPSCAPFHRPSWREYAVPTHHTAPWGHEWYVVDEHGLLRMHSAQYDSSD